MENIILNLFSNLSKMWIKIKNIENSLFPELKEQLGVRLCRFSDLLFQKCNFLMRGCKISVLVSKFIVLCVTKKKIISRRISTKVLKTLAQKTQ